jgi:pilus assembly protein CpaF
MAAEAAFSRYDAYLDEARRAEQDRVFDLQFQVHNRLIQNTDIQVLLRLSEEALLDRVRGLVYEAAEEMGIILTGSQRQRMCREVLAEVRGFGPLQELLDDETISEIMVNGPRQIYVEKSGSLERSPKAFHDDGHVLRILEKIISPLGRRLDTSAPMVDARLPDGSRVNAIIPPVALGGPTVTVRKFARDPYTASDLVGKGTMSEEMRAFLEACVVGRLNILVSGGTGSGKTTTLNVLSSFIPHRERIVTIEDAAELQLQQEHIVTLESRPPNIEGKGEVTIRMLVRNALRMRPDRIVVGECRGAEALDMLQAMNTGHDGSMSTIHANTPRDSISRLETLVLMAGADLPSRAIRDQMSSALDLIVQQARFRDGGRRITHITEVQRMEGEVVTLQDLYRFEQTGADEEGRIVGDHVRTGLRPLFAEKLHAQGIQIPLHTV